MEEDVTPCGLRQARAPPAAKIDEVLERLHTWARRLYNLRSVYTMVMGGEHPPKPMVVGRDLGAPMLNN